MADDLDIEGFRAKLEQRRAEIEELQTISADSRGTVALDQSSVGRLSRIDAMQAQQMALAAERQRQGELVRIEAALKRIEDGDYGYCLVCEEAIAPKRLAFDPAITTCVACAQARSA